MRIFHRYLLLFFVILLGFFLLMPVRLLLTDVVTINTSRSNLPSIFEVQLVLAFWSAFWATLYSIVFHELFVERLLGKGNKPRLIAACYVLLFIVLFFVTKLIFVFATGVSMKWIWLDLLTVYALVSVQSLMCLSCYFMICYKCFSGDTKIS